MTLLKLNDKQIDSLKNKAANLCRGDLILELLSSLYFEEKLELITREFNTRTASQIIESGYATGCTDFAIVLCAFLKQLNIPYEYVEVIEKRWLDAPMEEKKVMGHAYVKIDKLLVDPQRKIIYHDPSFVLTRYELFGEAQEPYELGLTDFQTNIQKYFDFKEKYKNNQ
jgi:hypothetical protein